MGNDIDMYTPSFIGLENGVYVPHNKFSAIEHNVNSNNIQLNAIEFIF